jgi:hypothetical protein
LPKGPDGVIFLKLIQTRFYTGIPDSADNLFWYDFWTAKLLSMSRDGVHIFSRKLHYRNKSVQLPARPEFGEMAGKEYRFLSGEEKGIDVRIAIDAIRAAHLRKYDVALIFSQDQDFSEAVDEIRTIAFAQNRWIKAACAFPASPASGNKRGINKTDWIALDRRIYDSCLDQRDYRRPK